MTSPYRLGDLFEFDEKIGGDIGNILAKFPDSIGAQYIVAKKRASDIETMTYIVLRHIIKNIRSLPTDIENSTVIHLRLGDVVAGTAGHEQGKRPLSVDYYKSIVGLDQTQKIYVIGKCFFASTSSSNFDECISESNKYLEDIKTQLNAIHFDGGNADVDLCCAVMCKCFVQGRGYFSNLIVNIRRQLGFTNIETEVSK